jgi:membrane carboxypeptidase/penicillin-binding protein PbpC
MAISIKNLKINNKIVADNSSIVPLDLVTLNWEYEVNLASLKQNAYEIRVAKNNVGWGTSSFTADVISQPYSKDSAQYWRLKTKFIQRGNTYYGQIRIKDTLENESEWVKFKFVVNRLPFVKTAKILPEKPSKSDDLVLNYSTSSDSVNCKIKWFRNGKYYSQFDNFLKISTEYLQFNDNWYCEITPYDGIEYGSTFFAKSVNVLKNAPISKNLQILPINPNVNDILEANFVTNDGQTQNLITKDKSKIAWYVNNQHIENADNQKFVRFDLKPDDAVYFVITPFDGIAYGETISSNITIIQDAGFRIINLLVDGNQDNLNVKGVNPVVEWDVIQPYNRSSRYAKIRIGTAPGASNI